jgi:1-acyl-sn-glycerol-3-phosphate acyltransferase
MSKGYKVLYFLLAPFFKFICGVKVVNPQNEPDSSFLVCSNHLSALDPIIIAACLKKHQPRYMGKNSLFRIPVLGWLIKALGAFPVDRSSGVEGIKKSIEMLNDGECVGIFPQGHRNPGMDPRETVVKNGVGMIEARTKSLVFPICIKTKGYKAPLFRRTYVIFGDPIRYEEFNVTESDSSSEKNKKITEYIFDKICDLGEKHES